MTTTLLPEEIRLCIRYEIPYEDVPAEYIYRKLLNKVSWPVISSQYGLSENFIAKYEDKVDWYWVSRNQKLSEDFIEKYIDNVSWTGISTYQTLSESFIIKYENKLDWHRMAFNPDLNVSNEFRKKYKDKLYDVNK